MMGAVDVFACTACSAVPELVTDGNAKVSVVRHRPGCAVLQAQVRTRWPLTPATLPQTPGQCPFENRSAYGRWHHVIKAREERRRQRDRYAAAAASPMVTGTA